MSNNLEHPFAGPPTNQEALRVENEKLKSRIDTQLTPVFEIIETQKEIIKDLRAQLAEAKVVIETTSNQLGVLQLNMDRHKSFESWKLQVMNVVLAARAYLEKFSND